MKLFQTTILFGISKDISTDVNQSAHINIPYPISFHQVREDISLSKNRLKESNVLTEYVAHQLLSHRLLIASHHTSSSPPFQRHLKSEPLIAIVCSPAQVRFIVIGVALLFQERTYSAPPSTEKVQE